MVLYGPWTWGRTVRKTGSLEPQTTGPQSLSVDFGSTRTSGPLSHGSPRSNFGHTVFTPLASLCRRRPNPLPVSLPVNIWRSVCFPGILHGPDPSGDPRDPATSPRSCHSVLRRHLVKPRREGRVRPDGDPNPPPAPTTLRVLDVPTSRHPTLDRPKVPTTLILVPK